jgi:hypothetical protein
MRERCRTIIGAAAAAGLAMIFVAGTASAFPGGAHFVSNNTSVSCQTGCITADFQFAGAGNNQGAEFTFSVAGDATLACVNPSGKKRPPGAQPPPFTAESSETVSSDRNGSITGELTVCGLTIPSASQICPSKKWTVVIDGIEYSALQLCADDGSNVNSPICIDLSSLNVTCNL